MSWRGLFLDSTVQKVWFRGSGEGVLGMVLLLSLMGCAGSFAHVQSDPGSLTHIQYDPEPTRRWDHDVRVQVSAGGGQARWGPELQESGEVDGLIDAVQREITVGAMEVELDSIVQYDRLSGGPGEIASVAYLVRTLQDEGITVTVDTFAAYVSDPVAASVGVVGSGFSPEAITVSGSGTVQGLRGPLVDLGTLADLPPFVTETGERLVLAADLPGDSSTSTSVSDLPGRIALVTGQPRPGPVTQLSLLGAAGVIFVNPEERLNDLTTTSVWGGPSLRNYHRIPSLPVAEVKWSAGQRLRSLMERGTIEVEMSTRTRTGWKPLHLAVATIPGPSSDSPYVLAGGHLDAWYHGGTDNAGANVAMLEVTRALHRHRNQLRRGLVVAWWPGHSNGRYAGSTWFVDQQFDELRRRALAYVNFEGLGQVDAKRFGAAATASLSDLAEEVILTEVGEGVRPSPPGRNSDQSFNGVGLPLLQLNHSRLSEDGGYWWWHTPEDTRDKVDTRVLKVDADLYAAALVRLLADPVFPAKPTATVERLGTLLRSRQEEAGEHLDLREALARQDDLLTVVETLEAALMNRGEPGLDLAVVAVLRPLHRVLYTLLGPYHPDPAVDVGSLPGLNPVDMLSAGDSTSDRFHFARATLLRERARILEAMDEAQARAGALLRELETVRPKVPEERRIHPVDIPGPVVRPIDVGTDPRGVLFPVGGQDAPVGPDRHEEEEAAVGADES